MIIRILSLVTKQVSIELNCTGWEKSSYKVNISSASIPPSDSDLLTVMSVEIIMTITNNILNRLYQKMITTLGHFLLH